MEDDPVIARLPPVRGNEDVWLMNADGSSPVNLTKHPAFECAPAWPPDGTKPSFVTDRDGNQEVYIMNTDESSPTNVTKHPEEDFASSWTSDGTRLVVWFSRCARFPAPTGIAYRVPR